MELAKRPELGTKFWMFEHSFRGRSPQVSYANLDRRADCGLYGLSEATERSSIIP
jgi:hypothetical protein